MSVNLLIHAQGTTELEKGAYNLNLENGTYTLLRSGVVGIGGAAAVDGTLWAIQTVFASGIQDFIVEWFMETDDDEWPWGEVSQGLYQLNGVASYDPWTDRIYAVCPYDKTGSGTKAVFVVDYKAKTRYPVTDMFPYGKCPNFIAAGEDAIYGIIRNEVSSESDLLVKIDKFTGAMETVGEIGFRASGYTGGATIDHRTGRMFISTCDMSESAFSVYEVDTKTGTATRILGDGINGPAQALGMWSIPDIGATHPGTPTNLSATFQPGELSGSVSFTAPTSTFDGTEATGDLTYRILGNGKVMATGSTKYGATVDVPVTFDIDNSYNISVNVANETGAGRYARTTAVAGKVKPSAPTATLSRTSSGKFHVEWDGVNTSDKGAVLDPSQITYKVTRFPDGEVVADGLTNFYYTDENFTPGDAFAVYYYEVSAIYTETPSDPGATNEIVSGIGYPAFEINLEDVHNIPAFSVIDANDDGVTFIKDEYATVYKGNLLCPHPSDKSPNDDYLVSPPVHLEAGMFYNVSWLMTNRTAQYHEKVRFKYGKSREDGADPTPEDLNMGNNEDIIVATDDYMNLGHYVKIDETGDYMFAIHNIGDNENGNSSLGLCVRGFKVGEGISLNAPDMCTDITVTPDYNDVKALEICFTAPTKTVGGDELEALGKIDVFRDDELIASVNKPKPGNQYKAYDTVDESGREYKYTIVPYNGMGAGMEAVHTAYVGIRKPGTVSNINSWEIAPGKVRLTWDAPTVDVEGNELNPANVSYSIGLLDGYVNNNLASGVTETEIEVDIDNPGNEPQLLILTIEAHTEGGTGETAHAPLTAMGSAAPMPFSESFAGGRATIPIGQQIIRGDGQWQILGDTQFSDGTQSFDHDGGMVGYYSGARDDLGILYTGKIDLGNTKAPILTLYALNIIGDGGLNDNRLVIDVNDGSGFVSKKSVSMQEAGGNTPGWHKIALPLSEYAGKTIQLRLQANIITYTYLILDNIRIREQLTHNLGINYIAAPSTAKSNTPFTIEAEVENLGTQAADGFIIDVYKNGDFYRSIEGTRLEEGKKRVFALEEILNPTDREENEYFFDLAYDLDEDIDDNISKPVVVKLRLKDYPGVENLRGSQKGKDAFIEWEAPTTNDISVPMTRTEGFEDCDGWETESAAGWIFSDQDGKPIGGVQDVSLPLGQTASFFVVDNTSNGLNASWASHSGTKYLSNMYVASGEPCDDWAISPELSGNAQKVSFYARSYSSDYRENMEVLCSLTDTEIGSFSSVETFNAVPSEWTLYTTNLPEGARHFAIRCTSADKFMLCIDDITYEGFPDDLTVLGYNVYRNGIRITEEPTRETSYTDSDFGKDGEYLYHVTPVYAAGEGSAKSVRIRLSGIDPVLVSNAYVDILPGKIVINNAEGTDVCVFLADGKTVFAGKGNSRTLISVPAGMYIVKISDSIFKVSVK